MAKRSTRRVSPRAPQNEGFDIAWAQAYHHLLAHFEVARRDRQLTVFLADVAGECHGVSHVRREFGVAVGCQASRHLITPPRGGEQSHRKTLPRASLRAD